MASKTPADVSSTNAVFLGALSSGVNRPTWSALKIVFLLLGVTLAAMLALAFSSSDATIFAHVFLLIIISVVLFLLLNSFLAQTGFVTVEQQMEEMGISPGSKVELERKEN